MADLARMRNLANSGLLRLPPEILDATIDHLSPADIRACSVTSSVLCPLARSRTLRSVIIRDQRSLLRALWFTRHAPELYKYTKSLTLDENPLVQSIPSVEVPMLEEAGLEVSKVLAHIPSLHTFVYHRYTLSLLSTIYSLSPKTNTGALATVTSLCIEFTSFPNIATFYEMLYSFPSITHLDVRNCAFHNTAEYISKTCHRKLPLSHVSECDNNTSLLYGLVLCAAPGSLRSITCRVSARLHHSREFILRGPVPQSLKYIELMLYYTDDLPIAIGMPAVLSVH